MFRSALLILVLVTLILSAPVLTFAHCDTLDGPVVQDARAALEKGEVTPVLKWITPGDETEIRQAFQQALQVRNLGPEAQELADRHFFETLVRVHRAAEGAPYTGLKPAGDVPQPIALADQALEKGSVDALAKRIAQHTEEGIRQRFQKALEAKKQANSSVAEGRQFVRDYVEYIHYVEGIVHQVHAQGHAH